MRYGIVYHRFCTVTGEAYVGRTWQDPEVRWRQEDKDPKCLHLYSAIVMYGRGSFVNSVLNRIGPCLCVYPGPCVCWVQKEMEAVERYWIVFFDCREHGYNIREGGDNGRHSIVTRRKLSQIRGGLSEPARALAISMYLSGRSTRAVGERFGVAHKTICNELLLAGVSRRSHVRARKLNADKILMARELYLSGYNCAYIGSLFGVSSSCTRRTLKTAGVIMRDPGAPGRLA